MVRKTKLAVIGAGTAGLTAIKEAQRLTQDVMLIDDGPLGTTCARVGCMPSKTLLAPAHVYARRKFLAEAGVLGTDALAIDLPAVLHHVRQLRDRYVAGPIALAESLGSRYLKGRPRFLDPHTLEVDGEQIEADAIVIATGSQPVVPDGWRALGNRVLTSDTVFEQKDLGRRVAVIGLGAIGVELGQALAQLGLDVTGLTRGQTVGGLTDPEVSATLIDCLREDLRIHTGVQVDLGPSGDAAVRVSAGDQTFEVDWVLASLGRRPNIEGLGLENLDIDFDERGAPRFDPATLRIGKHDIFIAGDVNGVRPIQHEAADEGRVAAYHALRPGAPCLRRRAPLGIVFTEPNAAYVGQRYAALPSREIAIGEVDFSRQGRALLEGRNAGRLRVYLACPDGRLLGAEMVAPDGEHLAHLLAWAVQKAMTVDELLQLPFYHPVVEEGLRSALQAARRALGRKRQTPDLPLCGEPAAWALGGN
ncbi:MAG: dihydrolipoyl dehydrogenase [Candidimonas sp.]|nr:MAG: dihydrolipoyl dehydrogenase [Candidimonas sp.]